MQEQTVKIVDGPDKPALQWALAYPDREQVHFKLENDGIDAQILRMDELGEGFTFAVQGVIKSGSMQGRHFHATYSIETRGGSLSIPQA
jgi:hypothetical protein